MQASQKGDLCTIARFAPKKQWKEINSTFDKYLTFSFLGSEKNLLNLIFP